MLATMWGQAFWPAAALSGGVAHAGGLRGTGRADFNKPTSSIEFLDIRSINSPWWTSH
jgi:hypothetical protein